MHCMNHLSHAYMSSLYNHVYIRICIICTLQLYFKCISICNTFADRVYLKVYINKSTAKLPYSKLTQYGIKMEGLPSGLSLNYPSSYRKDTLKEILSRRTNLTYKAHMLNNA